jgi:ASC-1-like (ASCH) protein
MNLLSKEIMNPIENPYLDWIISGKKTYEGRLANKIQEWDLHIGKEMIFFEKGNRDKWVHIRITSLPIFSDFGQAYDNLKDLLIPDSNCETVVKLYSSIFSMSEEEIRKIGVVAIGFKILDNSKIF